LWNVVKLRHLVLLKLKLSESELREERAQSLQVCTEKAYYGVVAGIVTASSRFSSLYKNDHAETGLADFRLVRNQTRGKTGVSSTRLA
jgi:hypothetical protein